jgi:pyruvate/2-oxoglutarate dehydrogenase complex dihydrolipoamide acyltransferase (E2) component
VATSPAAAPPAKASPPPATKDDPELAAMALLRAAKTRKDLGAAGVAISKMGLDAGARGRCMGVYNAAKESLPQ